MTCDVSLTVMTSSSHYVSKLYMIEEYSFLFPLVQNYKNRLRIANVIVENKVAPVFPGHGEF